MVPIPTYTLDDKRQVLLKREEWGSVSPFAKDEGLPLKFPVPSVLFTYTGTDVCMEEEDCKLALTDLREKYKKDGLYELPWNFVVGGDGTVFEARGWTRQPEPHPEFPEWAGNSLDIAHFGSIGTIPNEDQMIASWYIVNNGMNKRYIDAMPVRRTALPKGMEESRFRWQREVRDKELVIVPRDEWGGPPLLECEVYEKPYLRSPIANVILTYTQTDTYYDPKECKEKLRLLHLEAVEKGFWTVPYNFVVAGDGTVYEGRGWRRKPERSRVYPTLWGESLEIAHFGKKGRAPHPNQINGSWLLTLYGISRNYFSKKTMPDRHHDFL